LRSLNRTIEECDPDILHLHLPNPSTFWCLFSKSARERPWVIHWHSDVLGGVPNWAVKLAHPLYRIFERALLNRSTTIIVTSPPYLETSVPLRAFKHKCKVVPLGIKPLSSHQGADGTERSAAEDNGNSVALGAGENDVTDLLPTPERKGASNFEGGRDTGNPPASSVAVPLKVLCIGRLTYYKGHEHLIRAVAETPDVQLDIVGHGEEREALLKLIEVFSLSERARILGSLKQDDLEDALNNCDLVCLPSIERTEAFGLVVLEAARAGKPSLVTRVEGSGMSWVIQDGITGWTVEPGSAEDLKQVLANISKNRSELSRRGALARERFAREFQIRAVANRIQALYSEVGIK
jgi:glycosyltransferase involved in cell wall biosynthesis